MFCIWQRVLPRHHNAALAQNPSPLLIIAPGPQGGGFDRAAYIPQSASDLKAETTGVTGYTDLFLVFYPRGSLAASVQPWSKRAL